MRVLRREDSGPCAENGFYVGSHQYLDAATNVSRNCHFLNLSTGVNRIHPDNTAFNPLLFKPFHACAVFPTSFIALTTRPALSAVRPR